MFELNSYKCYSLFMRCNVFRNATDKTFMRFINRCCGQKGTIDNMLKTEIEKSIEFMISSTYRFFTGQYYNDERAFIGYEMFQRQL